VCESKGSIARYAHIHIDHSVVDSQDVDVGVTDYFQRQ
jgi:hypothetical protein